MTPNLKLLAERDALLARVRILDAERDALITEREYVDGEKQSRALAAEIILLGNQANALENQAHEIYQRAWINNVTVVQDGERVPGKVTLTAQNEGWLVIGDPRGPEWDAELFEWNEGDAIRERKAGGQL